MLTHFSRVQLFATYALYHQAPLSMGLSRQEYWNGLPCPPSNPGIKPVSLMSPVLAGEFFTTITTWEAHMGMCVCVFFFRFFSFIGYYKILNIVKCGNYTYHMVWYYTYHIICPCWLSILYTVLCIC